MKTVNYLFALIVFGLTFSPCSLAEINNLDPWESSNRKVASFNNGVDKYFLVPVAKGYNYIMPAPANQGVSNFIANTLEVNTMLNSTLQAKPKNLGLSFARFCINLTLGFFGLFDVATELGVHANKEDFGQTFARWGAPDGPYIVLPLLGPSTVRDGLGLYPNILVNPLITDNVSLRNSSIALFYTDKRAGLLEAESLITGDRYVFIRNAYLQNREFLNNDGVVEDDFGDEVEEDDWLDDDF
ncbi:MAG: VacJ family lipoprotein [Sinobacterium sp.]|nr:VacJ family lipoprotein [Sinobacterium sp.]